MSRREYTRRNALQVLGLGAVGTMAAGTDASASTEMTPEGQRDDVRIQFVDADPAAGFNYPYWLATPETFRSEPVPLLVTMNSARPGQPLTGGGPDEPPPSPKGLGRRSSRSGRSAPGRANSSAFPISHRCSPSRTATPSTGLIKLRSSTARRCSSRATTSNALTGNSSG